MLCLLGYTGSTEHVRGRVKHEPCMGDRVIVNAFLYPLLKKRVVLRIWLPVDV